MLVLKNINKTYHKKIINNFSYIFQKDNIYCIIGPSGCGKSTLLSIISNNVKSYSGKVFFEGSNIKKLKNYTFENVGYVYQSYQLIDNLTAYENVILPLIMNNKKINDIKIKVLFKQFNIYNIINNKAKDLSGGEKQRVAIIKTLLKDPKIILLDEPTSALDKETSSLLIEYLYKIKKDKIIIMVSHDMSLASKCETIIKFDECFDNIIEKVIEKKIKEEPIHFSKTKFLYNKVFKNNKLFNYLSTYILSIGLIGISLSFILNTFINNVVEQSFSVFNVENTTTVKSKNSNKIIDFANIKIKDYKCIYYEGIPSNIKSSLKESMLIDYIDFNYYDIKNVNFIYDNYISEYKENIVLSIPYYLSYLDEKENYINVYYQDKCSFIKVDKIIYSNDNNFYLFCNNVSYLSFLYKYYKINFEVEKYLYSQNAEKLYNYLLNNKDYNNYLFYFDKNNSIINIKSSYSTRINIDKIIKLSNNNKYIISDNINTYIDYDNGFSFLIINNELIQVIIDEDIANQTINISQKLSEKFSKKIIINEIELIINSITNEMNHSFIYMNSKTYNSLSTDHIYNAIIFSNDVSNDDSLLINKYLFQANSFNVFSYISKFIKFFSVFLIIEAIISSTFVFTINFIKKKKDIVCLLNLGMYKEKIAYLLLYDPINNIISAIISSSLATIVSSVLITYIYNVISNSSLQATISIPLLIFIILAPFVFILPLIVIKIYVFFKNQCEK